ncbi:MAG: amidohydrolase [bacterium]|nr:amidohydrolase [bacterium]
MSLPDPCRIVSADDHITPSPLIYGERLPKEFRDRAPRLESRGDRQVVIFEGSERPVSGLDAAAGARGKDLLELVSSKEKGRRGGFEPGPRIEDMDFDGVDVQVLFGSGYGGGIEINSSDRAFRFAMMQVYNDWLAEYCSAAPSRLVGIAEVPVWDPKLALEEASRCAKKGLRGVVVPAVPAYQESPPEDRPYTDPIYNDLWAGLADLDMPLNMHLGTRPVTRGLAEQLIIGIAVNKSAMCEPIASFIFSGALQRHPNLRVVSVESGIGWMAFFVQWIDHVWGRHREHTKSPLTEPPSFYFHRQVFGTFIEDKVGVRDRDVIGVENIMWSSDYPHINSTWPESRKAIEEHFEGVPDDEVRKMVGENAAKIYKV